MTSAPTTRVIYSSSHNPYVNLAFEQHILEQQQPGEVALLFYTNSPCLVIGRNQNPWRELRHKLAEQDGIPIARRHSGGGAVYHDLGNLNFSFIADKRWYGFEQHCELIFSVLKGLGIDTDINIGPGNSLYCGGKKFSGNAFRILKDKAMHHGTLLVSSDLNDVRRYLWTNPAIVMKRGVASRPASIMSLAEKLPELSVFDMQDALAAAFSALYGETSLQSFSEEEILHSVGTETVPALSTWDWLFGETPEFTWTLQLETELGPKDCLFEIAQGRVQRCAIEGEEFSVDVPCQGRTLVAWSRTGLPMALQQTFANSISREV